MPDTPLKGVPVAGLSRNEIEPVKASSPVKNVATVTMQTKMLHTIDGTNILLAVPRVPLVGIPVKMPIVSTLTSQGQAPAFRPNTYTQVRVKEVNVSSLLSVGLIWMRQLPCDRFLVGKAVIIPRGSPSDRGLAR